MLILASRSPRRRELLCAAGFSFEVIPATGEEIIPEGLPPNQAVMTLARQKAVEIAEKHPDKTVIGADTVVVFDGVILGKPKSKDDAFTMLSSLSGNRHIVYTGVCVVRGGGEQTFAEETEVEFYPLTDGEITDYIATGEPFDKAGAYGIQGAGMLLVKRINGDFYNVMGLPVGKLSRMLKSQRK